MKRKLALIFSLVLGLSTAGGVCVHAEETEPLVIAVQSQYCSSPIGRILSENMPETFDCPIEIEVFDGGPAINEAISEWDIAITGGAFIYAVANYDCKLIAHQCDGTGDDGVAARKGDPILDVLGDFDAMAEVVKGKTILTNYGTTGHYMLVLWLEQMGLSVSDVNIISQSFDNCFASWEAGESDYAVITSPYCYEVSDDTEFIASFDSVNGNLMEATVCTADAYNNKYDQVVKFVEMLCTATDDMTDPEIQYETVMNWYADNAKEKTEDDIRKECNAKPFTSFEEAAAMDLTEFATAYGEYYVTQDLIEADKVETITANCANDVLDDALAALGK